jgi:hypothetical protein
MARQGRISLEKFKNAFQTERQSMGIRQFKFCVLCDLLALLRFTVQAEQASEPVSGGMPTMVDAAWLCS